MNQCKIAVLLFGIVLELLGVLILINSKITKLFPLIPFVIFLLPIMIVFINAYRNKEASGWRNKIFSLKYASRFPLYFYKPTKAKSCLKTLKELQSELEEGDILLRKHRNSLDGLILGQTSYFTHIAIYYGTAEVTDPKTKQPVVKEHQVLHAVGNSGVCYENLEDFCNCEHIAVVRFSPTMRQNLYTLRKTEVPISFLDDRKQKMDHLKTIKITHSKHVGIWANEALPGDVLSFIQRSDSDTANQDNTDDEYGVYTKLIDDIVQQKMIYEPDRQTYLPLVKQQAVLKIGAKYDFNFNFVDFETLSCVEYVWYCYKCLFPLHQIKRKQFTYFNWIKAFVLVPDMFLMNSFFDLKYTTVLPHPDQNKLKRYARSHLVVFWKFLLAVTLWEMAILFVIYFISMLFKQL